MHYLNNVHFSAKLSALLFPGCAQFVLKTGALYSFLHNLLLRVAN